MVTMSTADNALKNVYLGVVSEQLNMNVNPLLSKIEKTSENVVGKEVHKVVTNGFNGGVGAGAEISSLPIPSGLNYILLKTDLRNLYGKIELSDKAIRASSSTEGAFVNLLNAEMEGLINSGKFHLGRMLYGNGTGYLTKLNSFEDGSDVFGVESMSNLMVGMRVDLVIDGEKFDKFTNVEIIDWDIANKEVTLSVACDEDAEAATTIEMYAHNAGEELTGLGAICDTTNVTTLYGVNRTNVSWLKPTKTTVNSTTFTELTMLNIVDNLSTNWNSEVDMILMSPNMRRKYQALMSANRINIDVLNLEGGYKALSFNGIPVVADRFVGEKDAYFVDSRTLKLHQLCDWEWLSNDKGQVLRQKEGYPVHTATLVKYAELICDKPAGLAKMEFV